MVSDGTTVFIFLFVVDVDTDNLLHRGAACRKRKWINNFETAVFKEVNDKPVHCRQVTIKLRNEVKPYNHSAARRIPIRLIEKGKSTTG